MLEKRLGNKAIRVFDRPDLRMNDGLPFFEAPCLAAIPWIRHGFLTRRKGIDTSSGELSVGSTHGTSWDEALKNRRWIATAFGFDPERLVMLKQVHRDEVLVVREPPRRACGPLEYDAMITDVPDLMLGIRTADCLPILIADSRRKVIAAVHAGRAGTALRITAKTLKVMKETFGCSPKDLLIAMGPSIGSCCYEIDEKVFQPEWAPFSIPCGEGRWRIDLVGINVAHLEREGVSPEQIEGTTLCTRCQSDLFFSYRKEGRRLTGTQLSFIGIITERS
jgi:hypothetical protein